jgi:hypothetical protein
MEAQRNSRLAEILSAAGLLALPFGIILNRAHDLYPERRLVAGARSKHNCVRKEQSSSLVVDIGVWSFSIGRRVIPEFKRGMELPAG